MNEITQESREACEKLMRCGIPVNNQSVLLSGVNDTVSAQIALCQGLLKIKVRPYYLFQADEVEGTEYLRTTIETGVGIIAGMRGRTSGLGIPTYIVDLPGGGGKVPIQADYLESVRDKDFEFKNYLGNSHTYHNPQC
jgi:lysine 2,3-aminomutase